MILDIEVYPNYFLALFKDGASYKAFEYSPSLGLDFKLSELREYMRKPLITFNGLNYDLPLVRMLIRDYNKGLTNLELKQASDRIINEDCKPWEFDRHIWRKIQDQDHIDLREVLPGVGVSLKLYGCRAGFKRLRELPYHPSTVLTKTEAANVLAYCRNDVDLTEALAELVKPQIRLREDINKKYGVEVRSKSDAQIAEVLISNYLEQKDVVVTKRTEKVKPFGYVVPSWLHFNSPEFSGLLDIIKGIEFKLSDKGAVVMPSELNRAFEYNGARYKFGIGGLHSQEFEQVIYPKTDQLYGEFDVASMYPSIIIEQGLYPKHLGPKFLEVYRTIKNSRLKAKREGDKTKADAYKIVLNGAYGKFGSRYSFLYSPELLIQTTITGQLALLMLIEMITDAGGKVVSANTDGVNVLYNADIKDKIHAVAKTWSVMTTYELEYTPYAATHSRDVNNYIAIKPDGSIKAKGCFGDLSLMKNPQCAVVNDAVIKYLANCEPVTRTIFSCDDVRRFVSVRTVRGGGVWRGEDVGKVCRWYYSTNGDVIRYETNGNKVPLTDGAVPLMDLPDRLPDDLDYDWYINEAIKIISTLEY